MLSFQQQQKVLRPILERDTNKHCADCGSHTPTWASLDFGVFVCSNCSGAHRALGPTITRIKSTKLDQWNKDWVQNMKLGNLEINTFWEADGKIATVKKPRTGATLDEHNRYVYDKYMKKKFVADKNGIDPLTAYKKGIHAHSTVDLTQLQRQKSRNIVASQPDITTGSVMPMVKKHSQATSIKKQSFNLLDDSLLNYDQTHHTKHKKVQQIATIPQNKLNDDDDQFSDYVSPTTFHSQPHTHSHTHTVQPSSSLPSSQSQSSQQSPSPNISFDQLFKQTQAKAQAQQQQQQQHNLNLQMHGYNGHSNYYNNFNIQPQYVNQFAHNPYIGYTPHNNLHAAYNMNFTFN